MTPPENDFSLPRSSPPSRLSAFAACCAAFPERVEISEWLLASAMAVVGLHLLIFPETVARSHMHLLVTTLPHDLIALACIWVGGMRLLFISGRKVTRRKLRMRALLAIVSAAIWLEMVVAFAARFVPNMPPPGIDMLIIVQVIGDFWVAYRIKRHIFELRAKGIL